MIAYLLYEKGFINSFSTDCCPFHFIISVVVKKIIEKRKEKNIIVRNSKPVSFGSYCCVYVFMQCFNNTSLNVIIGSFKLFSFVRIFEKEAF